MKIFNIEIRRVLSDHEEIKQAFLDRTEQNARLGLVESQLELRHHTLLLEQLPGEEEVADDEDKQREIRLIKESIERDHKSINNWRNQLKAINHERNT